MAKIDYNGMTPDEFISDAREKFKSAESYENDAKLEMEDDERFAFAKQ
jgi:hypothetical protein